MNVNLGKKILSLVVIGSSFLITCVPSVAGVQKVEQPGLIRKMAVLEASSGGRIGIYAINTANDSHLQYRANERFPTGCTSKVIGVAAILNMSMTDKSLLQQKMTFTTKELTNWDPVTETHLADGMTVKELCAAAISYSDNLAMNLLVKKMGGLQEINAFAHSIHNKTFRQDNDWPEEARSGGQGNLKDSSTPKDMAISLQKLAFTNILAPSQHELLLTWLKANTTGGNRIKAGVPKGWVVGDKTGTGMDYGTTNDIAVIWPPKCKPLVVAVYYTNNNKKAGKREDIVASATRILIDEFAKSDQCIGSNNITS